ncbi:MAG: SDR family oxidoreductase [Alphaproteobacteria bacterium]|nr:SDR family oxidoreductase [Alphaproteobacteria bacterium]
MGRVMVVTGASRGIGAATAIAAAAQGYAVCINYNRSHEKAEAVSRAVREHGVRAVLIQGSMGREADVLRLFEATDRELGPVTALINNGGIVGTAGPVVDASADMLAELFAVNITGCFLCAREAIKRMSTQRGGKGGSIVNVSSIASRLGGGGALVPYSATKGALDTFTIGLAGEVGPEGIRVNAVNPGLIDTDIHADYGEPNRRVDFAPNVPLRRAGTAEEVAKVIVWLCSDEASYVSRALIDVSGGW